MFALGFYFLCHPAADLQGKRNYFIDLFDRILLVINNCFYNLNLKQQWAVEKARNLVI
jgi:hypothetical protein